MPQKDGCDALQRGGQAVGQFVTKVGGLTAQLGLAVGIGGTGVAAYGAKSGNLGLTLAGVRTLVPASKLGAVGGFITVVGSVTSALSGSGKDAIVELGKIVTTSKLPNGVVKDVTGEIVGTALDAVVPEVKSCR